MLHKVFSFDEGKIHYWTSGEYKETILFTHGATMDHFMFEEQCRFFENRYKVISWDVPGHGRSRPWKNFSLAQAARALLKILALEEAGPVHLVGQSMGGYISQFFALKNPERVKSFCAIDSSPVELSYYSRLDRWLLSITPSLLKLYPYSYLMKIIARQTAVTAQAQAYILETLKKMSKTEMINIMRAVYLDLLNCDTGGGKLSCPVLVVYGELDRAGKVVSYCKRWAKKENLELAVIPRAGHNSNMDQPDVLNQTLSEFLSRISLQLNLKNNLRF